MMELIADSFDIRCCECGEQITIFKDDLDTDVSFYDHGENGMGVETIYEICHELRCPKCGNNIEITITGNEYPEGAYDYDSAEISGAEFIETPSMGMVYYQDEFAFANCPNLKTVIAPGVEICNQYSFYNCENLENVVMPKVTVADTAVFKNCPDFKTAQLGVLTEINNQAFYGCESLELVKTTADNISFTRSTFRGCRSLTVSTPENSTMSVYAEQNDIPVLGDVQANGSSIRVTDAGLRFGYQYNGERLDSIEEYGFVYDRGEKDNLTVDNAMKMSANNRIDHGDFITFNIVFTDIPVSAYGTVISARAYIKIGGEYFYSDTVTGSFNSVAEKVLADDEIDEKTKEVLLSTMSKEV